MKLIIPCKPPIKSFIDINGDNITVLPDEKMTLVAFFRDVHCPFCNLRIFELTQQYEDLQSKGLKIIAIFSASENEVRQFIIQRKRPFPVIADERSSAHDEYGLGKSKAARYSSMFKHMIRFMKGFKLIGPRALRSNSVILPADFIIDRNGLIIDCYYGKDYSDRMSLKHIKSLLEVG